jgi:hypothetical protein
MTKGSYRQPARPWFDELLREIAEDLTPETHTTLAEANRPRLYDAIINGKPVKVTIPED